MPHKGFKRNSKSKDKFHLLAIEALKVYGSASSSVLYDYAKTQHPTNQRWLPLRTAVHSWMATCPNTYRGSDGEWRLRTTKA